MLHKVINKSALMKYKILPVLLVLGFFMLWPVLGHSLNKWKTVKTDSFIVFYDPKYKTSAIEWLQLLEFYRPRIEKLIGSNYRGLPIVIEDFGSITNGFTDPIFKRIILVPTNPFLGELNSTENWASLVGVHEYTHMLHLTNTGNFPEILSTIFGNIFSPNIYSPGWIAEGIAVYSESKILNYSGRLNDGLYEAYLAARAKENKFPSLVETTNTPLSFPYYQGSYLYGSEFLNYLSQKYGEENFAYFFRANGGSMLSYFSPFVPWIGLDIACHETYGKSFPQLWKEWKRYEVEKHKNFSAEEQRITFDGWEVDNTCIYKNKLYYRRNYIKKSGAFRYFSFNEIVERDLAMGRERVLVSTPYPFTALFKIKNDTLYYSVAELQKGYHNNSNLGYGFQSVLHKKSILNGSDEELLACSLRAFEILDSGMVLYSEDRKDTFGSVICEYKNKQTKELCLSDYLINEIIAKDSQTFYISARKDWENFNIYSYNLVTNECSPLNRTPYYQGNLSLTGSKLFYSANYQQKYRVYACDFEENKNYSLTGDSNYAAYPFYDDLTNTLYFTGITSDGFDIFSKQGDFNDFAMKNESFSVKPDLSLTKLNIREGGYFDNIKTLTPKVWLPVGKSDEQESYWGAAFAGQSALGDFMYAGTVLFDAKNKKTNSTFSMASYLLSPFILFGTYDGIEDKSTETGLNYLLLRKLTPGISSIIPGLSIRKFGDFKRKEISPSLTISWAYSKTWLNLKAVFPYELDKTYTQGMQRQAYYLYSDFQRYISGREISINLLAIDDDLNPDEVFPLIRGYTKKSEAHTGIKYSLEYSQPLFRLRWGLWNPNFYFEDLCGVVFHDGIIGKNSIDQSSVGCELHLETKLMFGSNYDLGVRWSLNKENAKTTGVFFKTVF